MINNFLNTTLNSNSRLLSEARNKVEEASKQKVTDIMGNNIPNPQDLQNELQNKLNNPTQEQLLEAERAYNNFINLIDRAIDKLVAKKLQLESIGSKLDNIIGKITAFREFIDIIDPFLVILRGIPAAIDGALAASSGPIANGLTINQLGSRKKDIKDKVKKGTDAINNFDDDANFFTEETNKIKEPLDRAINKVQSLIDFLNNLKNQLLEIYARYLELVGLLGSTDTDPNNDENTTTVDDLINDPDSASTYVTDSGLSDKTFFIRKLNNQVVGYGFENIINEEPDPIEPEQ